MDIPWPLLILLQPIVSVFSLIRLQLQNYFICHLQRIQKEDCFDQKDDCLYYYKYCSGIVLFRFGHGPK
jgi:hypothetical protein